MKLKKILCMLVSGLLIFSMCVGFAACGEDEEPTEMPSDSESGTQEPSDTGKNTAKPYEKQTLSDEQLLKKEHDVTAYDVKKFTAPIWSGDICYAEAAFVRENEAGDVDPIQLLYPIEQIISVKSADLKTTYKEGTDYKVTADGKLEIIDGGRIEPWSYDTLYFPVTTDRDTWIANNSGKGMWWWANHQNMAIIHKEVNNNLGMLGGTVAVTYKHSGESVVTAPTSYKDDFYGDLIAKLKAGEDVKVVSMGDSITQGWSATGSNADGKQSVAPNTPAYNGILIDYMKDKYPNANITHTNIAVSGSGVRDGAGSTKLSQMKAADPDLVIIAYGMNDAGLTAAEFTQNINQIINYLKTNCPDAVAVVVGTCYPNPEMSWSNGGKSMVIGNGNTDFPMAFANALRAESAKWYNAAFADVASVNKEMYERKSHFDLTGSNSNHPNDYMHRVYAQVVIQTIFGTLS